MSCQEMLELMQRQLDEELTDEEDERWTAHSRHCPDCREKLERLKLLSLELSSLPKVTPAFSLVDAIMPELERIDGLNQIEATDKKIKLEQERLNRQQLHKKKRMNLWKTWGGVAAAAAVCGIFVGTYVFGPKVNVSDHSLPLAAQNMTASDLANSDQPVHQTARISDDQRGEVMTESFNVEKYKEMGLQPPTSENEKSVETNEPRVGAVVDQDVQITGKNDTVAGGGHTPVPTFDMRVNVSNDGASNDQEFVDQFSSTSNEEGKLSAGNAVSNDSVVSPNTEMIAHIKNYRVIIEDSKGQHVFIESTRKNGAILNLEWAEDSTKLYYEVHLERGAINKYVIDLSTGEEQHAR